MQKFEFSTHPYRVGSCCFMQTVVCSSQVGNWHMEVFKHNSLTCQEICYNNVRFMIALYLLIYIWAPFLLLGTELF